MVQRSSVAVSRALERLPTVLIGVMAALLAGYLVGLIRHGPDFEPLVDGWLGILTDVLPTVLCWLTVARAGPRRLEVAAMALAITSFTIGDTVYVLFASDEATVPFPSAADFGFLGFYPLALAAIAIAVRREFSGAGRAVWLDSALGGLGAAAVLAVLMEQLFTLASGEPLAGSVALIYPIMDLVMVAAVTGIVAMQGRDLQRHWALLLAGLTCFAAVDLLSALALFDESYSVGGTVDWLWGAGLALMSLWAVDRPPPVEGEERQVALVLPGIATTASLAVLVAASRSTLPAVAIVLAALTQVATAGRTQLAFRQLRRLADLRRQATTDELTGMPNRRAFYARAESRLAAAEPDRVPLHGLLLLDLDRFKEVNDSLGHHVGDQLLIEIGRRLTESLRDGDLIARLGGDEFAILLADTDEERAHAVALKLRAAIAQPVVLEGITLRTDASIGLSFAPEHGTELTMLLRHADIAMYKAKRTRSGHSVYNGADDSEGATRLRSLQELHTALDAGQMTLHYQPKLDLATNEVCDVEALVRWNHPERGLLYPDSFLTLIEDAGLMRSLTQVVLVQALDQAATWHRAGRQMTIAVNLSASSLVDTDLPEQIGALLAERELPSSALQVEITEEFLMADRDRTRDILTRLRERGVQIAVDDFGTGYSSLAYLRELPIDELKLDKSFVFPMSDDPRAAALVFSTVALAHSLGLRMVAEGVENEAALLALGRHGCDQAQGFYVSKPLPPADFDAWHDRFRARQLIPLQP